MIEESETAIHPPTLVRLCERNIVGLAYRFVTTPGRYAVLSRKAQHSHLQTESKRMRAGKIVFLK
jgi:hypothetical protein